MNSLICPFSRLLPLSLSTHLQLKPDYFRLGNNKLSSLSSSFNPDSSFSLRTRWASIGATPPSDEGPVSVINFEDFIEKDWSFLDLDEFDSKERAQKLDRIISAGEINKSSRAMIVTSSECFVDQVVESSPCDLLLIVHDSLFMLAGIKEKYDKVKCWQGELIYVPEKWVPFDVVFLYFLPALPFSLDQIFEALANRCLPGARVVISHPAGREALEKQRRRFPDVVISDLPDQITLHKIATTHSFGITNFVDDPTSYLAVLKFCKPSNSS